jgi:hypothetical protein
MNTFWAIVANAMVIGGAVGGLLLGGFLYMTAEARAAAKRR